MQARMVFCNIMEQCITQITPGLWPRGAFRKPMDLLPFPHIELTSSLPAPTQRELPSYPKYYHKAEMELRIDSAGWGQGAGAHSLLSATGALQHWLASEALGWIGKLYSKGVVGDDSEDKSMKAAPGALTGGTKLCWGFRSGLGVIVRHSETWFVWVLVHTACKGASTGNLSIPQVLPSLCFETSSLIGLIR